MPAGIQVTGPVFIYVGFPAAYGVFANTFQFLGTAEKCPRQQVRRAFEPVFNDIGGSRIPFDVLFEGQEGYVTADLTRWDDNVYQALAGAPSGTLPEGANLFGDVGAAILTEGLALHLVLTFPYSTKPAMGPRTGMPPGFHWYGAIFEGPDDQDSMGTSPRKIRCIWHCLRVWSISPGSGTASLLYDHTIPTLPAIT